jgi:guanylate kinase
MSSDDRPQPGLLLVVSAPSGTGKTTVVERLVERSVRIERSRSYTSRPPRTAEIEGVDYNFVSRDTFQAMAGRGAFLEWADIFGHFYGTSREDTEATLAKGVDLVLVIDVQGARQVRALRPDAIGVFVLPPSFDVLADRLRRRNQDSEDAILRRLDTARREVTAVGEYDYVVVNDDVERAVTELEAILLAERARRVRRQSVIDAVTRTFGVLDADVKPGR